MCILNVLLPYNSRVTALSYQLFVLVLLQAARNRMVEYKIPQDAQWGDIDIMERSLDFTGMAHAGEQGSFRQVRSYKQLVETKKRHKSCHECMENCMK